MTYSSTGRSASSLNEVQLPKELQLVGPATHVRVQEQASMKCSSRRNCNRGNIVEGGHNPRPQ